MILLPWVSKAEVRVGGGSQPPCKTQVLKAAPSLLGHPVHLRSEQTRHQARLRVYWLVMFSASHEIPSWAKGGRKRAASPEFLPSPSFESNTRVHSAIPPQNTFLFISLCDVLRYLPRSKTASPAGCTPSSGIFQKPLAQAGQSLPKSQPHGPLLLHLHPAQAKSEKAGKSPRHNTMDEP